MAAGIGSCCTVSVVDAELGKISVVNILMIVRNRCHSPHYLSWESKVESVRANLSRSEVKVTVMMLGPTTTAKVCVSVVPSGAVMVRL